MSEIMTIPKLIDEIERLRKQLATVTQERDKEIESLQQCQCDGCEERLEGDAYCLRCVVKLRQQLATARQEELALAVEQARSQERTYWKQQLATARQAVWEEAAKKCHELLAMVKADTETWGNPDLNEMLHGRCQAHANFESYCRDQARKEDKHNE